MNAFDNKMGNFEQETSGIHEEEFMCHKSKCLDLLGIFIVKKPIE